MRIVVIGQMASYVVAFRGDLLRALVELGHEVLAMAPEDDDDARRALAVIGVSYERAHLQRTGMNPLRDMGTVVSLARALRRVQPDIVLGTGAKPVIYGSIAARAAGVPLRVAMITGIGSALGGGGSLRRRGLARMLRLMYASALRGVGLVIFQNQDDAALFRSLSLIADRQRVLVVNGSGVNLDRFSLTEMPRPPITFLMVGRLIQDKGVNEYVAAARIVRREYPDARLQLLGPLDTNPSAVRPDQLRDWRQEGVIEYLGETTDVRPFIAGAHVCVLPSYREGVPRSVLEAMAMGRPVITTDVPGCRETVADGRNGYLVPARDPAALAVAMVRMLRGGMDGMAAMGLASRRMAEAKFDVHGVNRVIIDALGARTAAS